MLKDCLKWERQYNINTYNIIYLSLDSCSQHKDFTACFVVNNTASRSHETSTAVMTGQHYGFSGLFFGSWWVGCRWILPTILVVHSGMLSSFLKCLRQITPSDCLPGSVKPSQSGNWGGGDLREAQVDVSLSVSHSCFWPHSWAL